MPESISLNPKSFMKNIYSADELVNFTMRDFTEKIFNRRFTCKMRNSEFEDFECFVQGIDPTLEGLPHTLIVRRIDDSTILELPILGVKELSS